MSSTTRKHRRVNDLRQPSSQYQSKSQDPNLQLKNLAELGHPTKKSSSRWRAGIPGADTQYSLLKLSVGKSHFRQGQRSRPGISLLLFLKDRSWVWSTLCTYPICLSPSPNSHTCPSWKENCHFLQMW